mgnify:CR=1 FL=1
MDLCLGNIFVNSYYKQFLKNITTQQNTPTNDSHSNLVHLVGQNGGHFQDLDINAE